MAPHPYAYAFLGGLRQDYCITHDGRVLEGVLGGNAVYAAAGARVWSASVGLVSRVGYNYPREWLHQLEAFGFNLDGVHVLPDAQDTRTFYAYLSPEERVDTDPTAHYLRLGRPLPKELLGYTSSTEGQHSRQQYGPLALRPEDLPPSIARARAAHLCPGDYLSHSVLPLRLRELGVPVLTLDPSARYMDPSFRLDLPLLLKGLDAFLPSQAEVRSFFHPGPIGLWEAAEALAEMGTTFVGIKCGARGLYLWDSLTKARWQIPAYPAAVRDVTGAGDAFCGGFLVGLAETDDAVEAALRGCVSASVAVEGAGALFALDATPGLAEARLHALRPAVKRL